MNTHLVRNEPNPSTVAEFFFGLWSMMASAIVLIGAAALVVMAWAIQVGGLP